VAVSAGHITDLTLNDHACLTFGEPEELDLSGLTGWDSCGLAALITAQQLVDNHPGGRMIVAALPGHLRERLLAADLPRQFTLAESVDDAKGMFNPPA
jgi:anti-anti-sigma regulatory factor